MNNFEQNHQIAMNPVCYLSTNNDFPTIKNGMNPKVVCESSPHPALPSTNNSVQHDAITGLYQILSQGYGNQQHQFMSDATQQMQPFYNNQPVNKKASSLGYTMELDGFMNGGMVAETKPTKDEVGSPLPNHSRNYSFIDLGATQEVDGIPPVQYQYPIGQDNDTLNKLTDNGNEFKKLLADQQGLKDILQCAIIDTDLYDAFTPESIVTSDDDFFPDLGTELDHELQQDARRNEMTSVAAPPPPTYFDPTPEDPVTQLTSGLCAVDIKTSPYVPQGSPSDKKAKKSKIRCEQEQHLEGPWQPASKKQCLWEISEPYHDKEMEKKRQDAIRARRNRIKSKNNNKSLEEQLRIANEERDQLRKEVEKMQSREKILIHLLKKSNSQAVF